MLVAITLIVLVTVRQLITMMAVVTVPVRVAMGAAHSVGPSLCSKRLGDVLGRATKALDHLFDNTVPADQ